VTSADLRILELGASQLGVELTPQLRHGCAVLTNELQKWGKKINLTAIHGHKEMVVKHLLDSLSLCKVIGDDGMLLDLGSGAGFPGIPMKLARPHIKVVSVDAVEKKIIFQRHVSRLLNLHDFTPIHGRGEELAGRYAGSFDWIVSRAFSDIPTFTKMALPLLKPDGRIIAMKGKGGMDEAGFAERPLMDMGVRVVEVKEFLLPISNDSRALIIITPI
jgi:16S rRNA (guanine527-N7)-methyltransferase